MNKQHELANQALRMADAIFRDGRIKDAEDWAEMEAELKWEMDEKKIEGEDRKVILDTVKKRWY